MKNAFFSCPWCQYDFKYQVNVFVIFSISKKKYQTGTFVSVSIICM